MAGGVELRGRRVFKGRRYVRQVVSMILVFSIVLFLRLW